MNKRNFALFGNSSYFCNNKKSQKHTAMKRFLLLLGAMIALATACMPDGSYNGELPEQPENNQQQDEITLMVEASTVPNFESEWFITVTSNCNWKASADEKWITNVTKSGSAGTNKLEFKILDNPYTHEREGHIVVTNSDGSVRKTLTLIQDAHKEEFVPSIEVDVDTNNYIGYEYKGGELNITITANIDYIVECPANWLTYTETASGITISIAANDTGEGRLGNIMIWNPNPEYSQYESTSKVISIRQNPAPYKIGDIVTKNGGKGIVFHIGSDGIKIISVTEGECIWSTENRHINTTETHYGAETMAKVKAISDWATKYPAFKWCADYGTDWYLPSLYELNLIKIPLKDIDAVLSENGYPKLTEPSYHEHWSSSEVAENIVHYIVYSSNTGGHMADKNEKKFVRAVYTFE